MAAIAQPFGLVMHFSFIFLFSYLGIPALAIANVFSVFLWLISIVFLRKHNPTWAVLTIVIEVILHAALVIYFIGWGMGMQYYLIPNMFAIAISHWPRGVRLVGTLTIVSIFLLFYYYALANPPQVAVDPLLLNTINIILIVTALLIPVVMILYAVSVADRAEADLEIEHEKSEALLHNVLPKVIVDQLKIGQGTITDPHQRQRLGVAESFTDVSVLFADIVGFTPLSEQLTPQETVDLLDEIFTSFDMLVEKYGVEKIRTIGDGYMVAAGVPVPLANHAKALVSMALDMQELMKQRAATAEIPLQVRIGINSGPAVAGIVGTTKFHYDLWGDMVNIASRMESHGQPSQIQVARPTYELIKDDFHCVPQGKLEIKGKGVMDTWFVTGSDSLSLH